MCNGCTYNYGKSEQNFSTLHPYYIARKKLQARSLLLRFERGVILKRMLNANHVNSIGQGRFKSTHSYANGLMPGVKDSNRGGVQTRFED